MLLQDPSGQCPPNGRADDHVFNDVLYLLGFELMAGREPDLELAGQYRRAALLSFQSIQRWKREEPGWEGSFFVTKNHFDPALRVGYQDASNYGNYNGAVMIHLAEAYLAASREVEQRPAPCELGGFALATDGKFASAVANAGGTYLFAALRGDTEPVYGRYWTALGVERFSAPNWDSRLGPSDGVRDLATGRGISFGRTWVEDGEWVRIADVPERYEGVFSVQSETRGWVEFTIDYLPLSGEGPRFRHEFLLLKSQVIAKLTAEGVDEFGVTWPLLINDGRELEVEIGADRATVRYREGGDEQLFLTLSGGSVELESEAVLSSYGWLRSVRVPAVNGESRTLIYPRGAGDEAIEEVCR